MYVLPAFAALSALAAATFTNAAPSGRERLYARSFASGHGIEAHFEFWGRTDGTGTFVKIEVLKGLLKDSPDFQGPFGYHVHTNPVGEERNCTKPTHKPSKFVKHYPTAPPTNPPQVVTPFVGETMPDDNTLHNLPFPLPNPAIPLFNALNVQLTVETQTVWVNGSQTQAKLPVEKKSSDKPPFHGFTDHSWTWYA
ncbi:hypothetical protein FRB90_007018 [Tulasnella sp. 427]|nr:hypothetical protein FRB90_007018 [Tulasnella sp. 427]